MTGRAAPVNSWTIAIAAAGLGLSAATVWSNMTNRSNDRLDAISGRVSTLDSRVSSVEVTAKNNSERLDKDEAWISWVVRRDNGERK